MKHWSWAVCCAAMVFLLTSTGWCATNPVSIAFGNTGLTSLTYGGVNFLANGTPVVLSAQMSRWDGSTYTPDLTVRQTIVNTALKTITRTFIWGSIQFAYTTSANRLIVVVTAVNNSQDTLSAVLTQPVSLKFPAVVSFDGGLRKVHNVGEPSVIGINYGSGELAISNDDVGLPLYVGVAGNINDAVLGTPYPILTSTARNLTAYDIGSTEWNIVNASGQGMLPPGWLDDPIISRPIYSGTSDHWKLSFRFGVPGQTVESLATDVFRGFAQAYPPKLNWPDRRSIGQLILSSAGMNFPKNPCGWFHDSTVDVTTPAGLASFQQRVLDWAAGSVSILTSMHSQGMITWDIEGEQWANASYMGDPRSLPPEMEAVVPSYNGKTLNIPLADAYFNMFTDAGFKVGVCLRPTRPVRAAYGTDCVQDGEQYVLYNLEQKVKYANQRWGCTIFYIDSTCDCNPLYNNDASPWSDPNAYQLEDASIYKQLAAAFPNCLFCPEQRNMQYWAYTAPYMETRQNYTGTDPHIYTMYPNSFCLLSVSGLAGMASTNALVNSVKRGDILMYQAWWPNSDNPIVAQIYQQAGKW